MLFRMNARPALKDSLEGDGPFVHHVPIFNEDLFQNGYVLTEGTGVKFSSTVDRGVDNGCVYSCRLRGAYARTGSTYEFSISNWDGADASTATWRP